MIYYKKPANVTYTQMCMWIDENVYKENCDDNLVFEYLYHITRMLAYKRRFFEKASYYDDFAIYCATRIFLRLRDKRQFDENSKLTKVKSVLNYTKSVLYASKVSFESEEYAQNYNCIKEEYYPNIDFHSSLISSIDGIKLSNFSSCLNDSINTIKIFINKLPHKDSLELQNIYTSCILSLLNSLVLSNKNKEKLQKLKQNDRLKMEHINKLFKKERDDCVLLYHLDLSMKSYIKVLVNEIRHLISEDLSNLLNEDIESESSMKNILLSSLNMDLTSIDDYN